MHHIKEWLAKNKSEKFILIFTTNCQLNIAKMFIPNAPMACITNINVVLASRAINHISFKYKNKNIYTPTYEKYFIGVEEAIRDKGAHYYKSLKQHVCLSDTIYNYRINKNIKDKIHNIANNLFKNNFIIISPETLSNNQIGKDFWNKLVKKIKDAGYEVFCNAMNFDNLVDNTISIFLTYEEAMELAKYSKAIIGMRSGFLECLSQSNVPLFALYTDFPKRLNFERLASDKVLSGFSISELPNVNRELLFEYDMNSFIDKNSLIELIFLNIIAINKKERSSGTRR